MKITLEKIANDAFTEMMQQLITMKVPVRTAFKLKTLVNKINDELKKLTDLRKDIIENRCKKGEDGKPLLDEDKNYQFEPDQKLEFAKEIAELLSVEVDVEPIKLSELGSIDLTTQQLFDLGDVIDGQ
jgi:hypothetical protein